MANFVFFSPIKFIEGTGLTINLANTEIILREPRTVTFSIGQPVSTTSDVIFGSASGSTITIDNSVLIQDGSISNLTSLSNTSFNVTENFTSNNDVIIKGRLTGESFISEVTESVTIFKSGSTQFGDTIDDNHDITGSLQISGSIKLKDTTSVNEISNDTGFSDGNATSLITENSIKSFVDSTDSKRAYLRKSFTHTGSFVNSSTASFTAVTASAPTGFSATSEDDFMFFINGNIAEHDALTIQQANTSFLLKVNNNSIGYDLESTDEIVAFGKFNS